MKKYSSKRSIQLLGHILKAYGITDVVISPGSRNAPLAIHFGEMDAYNTFSIVDERSAGFVALGMAMSTKKPVAITCTSGSAAANYYPAVTEAFYANVPLLILTADRPTDFVDIFDGQTIRQKALYQQHSYGDFELTEDSRDSSGEINAEIIKKAVELCLEKRGPVHINIPLEEPLYDLVTELPLFPAVESTLQKRSYDIPARLIAEWNTARRIMILVGTRDYSPTLEGLLGQMVKNHSVVVLSEVNSNLHHDKFFTHIDRYILNIDGNDSNNYGPDLLITVGQNVVSKKVKQFLRKARPKAHWHIDEIWQPDTYFALKEKIMTVAEDFFFRLINHVRLEPSPYYNLWSVLKERQDARHKAFAKTVAFSDFYLFSQLPKWVPEHYNIHFSNSSAIRYAQLFELTNKRIFCNRGTSGIDGSTSTAMGFAIKNENPTLLVTGDLSFFYDINGLWNGYIPPATRIIIFNNGEGNIFKIIPGPTNANSNVLDEFIATTHHRTAELLAKHFGFSYARADDEESLDRTLANFFKPGATPQILEVFTADRNNADILKQYFNFLGSKQPAASLDTDD